MKLNWQTYNDKVRACWLGKNIGGTMGTPYEGRREFLDVKGFSTEKNVVLPNDDLDLQLVWLRAMEICGARGVTAQQLGEFWLSFITPHWNEYGLGKNNMRQGFYPPLSGEIFTTWKDSNGAWIRTEIWACLTPGAVDLTTEYAYRDACIDHGVSGEGTIAAVFVAALESAAFFENDLRSLIEIGLSRIPENSRVAQSVRTVVECYDKGLDYKTTRNTVLEQNKDIGNGWFEAPSNVAYVVIGLLYGGGDFKKSMICAINCGDDTDCTAGTVGAILGLMGGTAAIPKDWQEHIGDNIVTMSISTGVLLWIPKTCSELAQRVARLVPHVLFDMGANVELTDGETECDNYTRDLLQKQGVLKRFEREKYSYSVDLMHTIATVALPCEPRIEPLQTLKVKLRFEQKSAVNGADGTHSPYYLKFRWWTPEGFTVKSVNSLLLPHATTHTAACAETEAEIAVPEKIEASNRIVLGVTASDKMTIGYVPITLLG